MRLGLLGGTFDPIHMGHLQMAETALRLERLDIVHFVTSVNPPHKSEKTQANFLDRHAMVALALADKPKFIPSSLEYDRAGKSYSIDTVRRLRQLAGKSGSLFFLIGLDAFLDIPSWKDYQQFPDLCSFLIFTRPGYDDQELVSKLPDLFQLKSCSIDLEQKFKGKLGSSIIFVKGFSNQISSTEIRERIRQGKSVSGWVPEGVLGYLKKTKLYKV